MDVDVLYVDNACSACVKAFDLGPYDINIWEISTP